MNLRRTPFRTSSYPKAAKPPATPIRKVAPTVIDAEPRGVPKTAKAPAAGEKAHKDAVAQLGCMVCLRLHGAHDPAPVELHHLRKDGWGKGSYLTLIPLCAEHHRGNGGVHGLGTKGFAVHYGFDQVDLLNDTLTMLGKQ